ncbi:MAG: hypothetical protein A2846_02280 [Candidatus Doudnabacteria bacterium RIFCSPHIGHO2_01_FULL_49_9]|uniref:Bacterial type II secretion system protein E domain-containing protein n=1 Tax=Candidatus Doudnabacteria bacterium RIFCSPHIGHO2_01_FULL_49_9 TaxID=1817827 RepID=A0A1F5P3S8_9BACT|nr:MAG: hypothetical protein A2846_02280 [Candidatus Doudnabacteria bacterium RIFCSPHIGHO2_01_FULL_49_9]
MVNKEDIIKDLLLRRGYVTAENIASAEDFAVKKNSTVIRYLIDQEILTKDIIGQAVAEEFQVPYADLNSNQPPKAQVLLMPQDFARRHMALVFQYDDKEIVVATDAPHQPNLLAELDALLNRSEAKRAIKLAYSLQEDLEAAFVHYRESLSVRFIDIIKDQKRVAPEIIEEIFEDAILYRVSDVHFEPQDAEVLVRFRIDGVLREVGRIPREYYENILNRVKVQARLRIDDHFSAQDGALRYEKNGASVDARVSIMPTLEGEKIAIRLLSEYVRNLSLKDLGLTEDNQKILSSAAEKPFGMILVTGPTGSGKTTTLYALLKILNDPEVNITTIEDPVEYRIKGLNQIQVNADTNLTFADGLRSIVRQDPDIILVGEIRDNATAEISVNAALTGHLLFSTFHANDAPTSIPRLLDMDVEPFLLASTLKVIIAQRLVRRICESCRYSVSVTPAELKPIGRAAEYLAGQTNLYRGKGCNVCGFTGYKGRIGIFEFIDVTPEMQNLILKNPSTSEIWALARSQGARSLFEDGIFKVIAGVTTIDELMRVAEPPKN